MPAADATEKWLAAAPGRAGLKELGFTMLAQAAPGVPFIVVEAPAESCVLLAPEDGATHVALRNKGGTSAIGPASGNTLWCAQAAATLVVQRSEGDGAISVLAAPAAKLGGLTGAREVLEGARVPIATAGVPGRDHAWSARLLLLASAIPESLVTVASAPELGDDPEARIIALSVDKPGSFAAEPGADVFSYCNPQLAASPTATCIFSGKHKWRVEGTEGGGGLARAKTPFWLLAVQNVSEPTGLKLETDLVTLARRLRRDGFEPTTIEAVTENDRGAEVLGRANEDAIVVVGLSSVEPWVVPYTDGASWSLGASGEPRVVPIQPLQRIQVRPVNGRLAPKATRRTLVFRRQKR
jgi:hypothetical protein